VERENGAEPAENRSERNGAGAEAGGRRSGNGAVSGAER